LPTRASRCGDDSGGAICYAGAEGETRTSQGKLMSIDGRALDRLYAVICERRGADPQSSYTAKLLAAGAVKIAQKVGEEAVETVIEGARGNAAAIVAESADLLYHLLVLWAASGITPMEVWQTLESRQGRSGIAEKQSRSP